MKNKQKQFNIFIKKNFLQRVAELLICEEQINLTCLVQINMGKAFRHISTFINKIVFCR